MSGQDSGEEPNRSDRGGLKGGWRRRRPARVKIKRDKLTEVVVSGGSRVALRPSVRGRDREGDRETEVGGEMVWLAVASMVTTQPGGRVVVGGEAKMTARVPGGSAGRLVEGQKAA